MKLLPKLLYSALAVLVLDSAPADAQRPAKIAHIGFLATVSRSTMSDRVEAFRQGLRDLGYVEAKNIIIEWRFAEGKANLLPNLASDLVRLNVSLIVTAGSPVTQAVRQATAIRNFQRQFIEHAAKNRLPAIYERAEFVSEGGLLSYGASMTEIFRRATTYVDKILKGAKPGDLSVEQPTKFELVINVKTAKQIGLTIPPNVLARADRVLR